jgi:predicted TIM-barrel fold metal-dependent hydrolase
MPTEHEKWLSLTIEDPLEPDLPICDAHHHLWDHPGERYLLDEFSQDIGNGHNITQTVFIDAQAMYYKEGPEEMKPVGETEFVQSLTTREMKRPRGTTKVAAGIISNAALTLGALVAPVLEAHIKAGKGRFRGIRNMAVWDENPEFTRVFKAPKGLLLKPEFREGFACLGKYNLSFDVMLFHPQLTDLVDLARTYPDTTIILNHIGAPLLAGPYAGKREEMLEEWKRYMSILATCPNVFVKLGGVGIALDGVSRQQQAKPLSSSELAQALSPFFLWCIQHFGVNRCMFESNFPVDRLTCSYTVLWNAFKRITTGFSPAEKSALFYDTAVKAYRLEQNS